MFHIHFHSVYLRDVECFMNYSMGTHMTIMISTLISLTPTSFLFFYFSMHNIIQELRGNVRVFARIRPFLPDDGKQGDEGGDTPLVSHEGDAIVSVVSYFIR